MTFPRPVIEVAIEPKSKSDQEGVAAIQMPRRRGSLHRLYRQEDRPDRHARHGRAAPGHQVDRMRREFKVEANVGARRSPTADDPSRAGNVEFHPQRADGRLRPVREGQVGIRPAPNPEPGGRLSVREQGHRCRIRAIHPLGRKGPEDAMERRARRLPSGRHQGEPCATAPTTTSTPRRSRSRSPVDGLQKAARKATRCCLEPMMAVEVDQLRTTWAT